MRTLSRRRLLQFAGVAGSAAIIGPRFNVAMVKPAHAQRVVRDRVDIAELSLDDPIVVAYKKAVGEMNRIASAEPNNPIGWMHQARIHRDKCPHGNWFFLPWHRAYLYYFEDICRTLSGYDDFALPYWNWTKSPQIPAALWGSGNPLNHRRTASPNTSMPDEFVGPRVINRILGIQNFEDFASFQSSAPRGGSGGGYGELEATPHNNVHCEIGGDMCSFMSPLDPVFWLHHCNVDRLWTSWNATGNANSNNRNWRDFVFRQNFVDAKGAAREIAISETLSTEALGYRYDRLDGQPRASFQRLLHFQPIQDLTFKTPISRKVIGATPLSTGIGVTGNFRKAALDLATSFGKATRGLLPNVPAGLAQAVKLVIRGLKVPESHGTYIRVFLNCPYLSSNTPINDPHYVGSIAFFVDTKHRDNFNKKGLTYTLDITETLDNLRRAKRFPDDRIEPQLLAVGPGVKKEQPIEIEGDFQVTFQRAEI